MNFKPPTSAKVSTISGRNSRIAIIVTIVSLLSVLFILSACTSPQPQPVMPIGTQTVTIIDNTSSQNQQEQPLPAGTNSDTNYNRNYNGTRVSSAAGGGYRNSNGAAGSNGGDGYGGNMTPEQRQQLFTAMRQAATNACSGMSEGDSCTIPGQNGRSDRTGTCETYNDTLSCNTRGAGMNGAGANPVNS